MELGLSFDDVMLIPKYSEVLPKDVDVSSKFSRNISLKIPLVSAAMDTVTEENMAIALARHGGIGVIHRNLTPEDQAEKVRKVKRFEQWIIREPVTATEETPIYKVKELMESHGISGVPIVDKDKRLVGIITKRDLKGVVEGLSREVKVLMRRNVIKAQKGISLEEAKKILQEYGIEKLPVVDEENRLIALITMKDILRKEAFPNANLDELGRLKVSAAIGVGKDFERRVDLLLSAEVDALVIDTAHAYTRNVIERVKELKRILNSKMDLIVGNVATYEAAKKFVDLDVSGIKVGIGAGSICTTRIIAGVGVPQLMSIMEAYKATKGTDISLIADGGIRYSGDIVKALAAGADCVMIGNLFAGTDEAPGESVLVGGRRFKVYRGMGSLGAMTVLTQDRYGYEGDKFVPEGVEGIVPYRGSVSEVIFQLIGGIRSGMGYVGAKNIMELREKADFIKITPYGLRESHPHNIIITKEAPNYFIYPRDLKDYT